MKRIVNLRDQVLNLVGTIIDSKIKRISNFIIPLANGISLSVFDLYKQIKENIIFSITEPTIYNYLILAWISKNLPLKNDIISFEDFERHLEQIYPQAPLDEEILSTFYSEAYKQWKTLDKPSSEDIMNACLKIVAFAINKRIKWQNETFGISIYLIFEVMLSKNIFLIPDEVFVSMVREYLSTEWKEERILKKASLEFYKFAKRFIMTDIPLASIEKKNFMLFKVTLRNKFDNYCDSYLDVIEDILKQDYFQKIDKNNFLVGTYEFLPSENSSHFNRLQFLAARVYQTRNFAINKLYDFILNNNYFNILDKNLHILNNIKSLIQNTDKMLIVYKNQIYNPFIQFINSIHVTINDVFCITIDYVNNSEIQKSFKFLKHKFKNAKEILIEKYKNTIKISITGLS